MFSLIILLITSLMNKYFPIDTSEIYNPESMGTMGMTDLIPFVIIELLVEICVYFLVRGG